MQEPGRPVFRLVLIFRKNNGASDKSLILVERSVVQEMFEVAKFVFRLPPVLKLFPLNLAATIFVDHVNRLLDFVHTGKHVSKRLAQLPELVRINGPTVVLHSNSRVRALRNKGCLVEDVPCKPAGWLTASNFL